MTRDRTDTRARRALVARGVLAAVVAALALGAAVGGLSGDAGVAAASNHTLNDTAPYYDNETALGNNSGWFPDGNNVSLDVLGEMATRLGPYVIGTGQQIPGGTTYAGTIVTALLMVAVFLGAVGRAGVGNGGGVVVAATVGYGMTTIGLAPPWLRIVLLMLIGTVAAVAALRVTR